MSAETNSMILFGLFALLLLFIGSKKGFFRLPKVEWIVQVRLIHLFGAFIIYFLTTNFLSLIAIKFFQKEIMMNYLAVSSWLNFSVSFGVFIFLAIYMHSLPGAVKWGILRREHDPHLIKHSFFAAFYALILAFPIVLFLSQGLEYVVIDVFKITALPEQVAVKFLKSTFETSTFFILAILSITILAPLIEETLFRGFLQTFIRKHLGSKQAILITSICFSLFHYASSQGLGNISIIVPLFVLALFLGFLYEKQGTLLAPIFLHSAFNTINVINLYMFGGT